KITRQDIELPKPAPSPPQQQIVDEIIIKENDEVITDAVETDFGFSEEDIVDFTNTAADDDDETIFILAEYLPEYPGGHNALRSFVSTNIKYPRAAKDNKIQGTVYLRFEVKKTGKIGKIEIQKGVNPLLDEEAVRVVSLLPDFIPGSQNGKAVNVWYSLPIEFRLTNR
ncbi:MAG: TonB family protein, partial [Ignavibacteria bacterium]|nr:TonB family protein [Ignavibacteria bacterium]